MASFQPMSKVVIDNIKFKISKDDPNELTIRETDNYFNYISAIKISLIQKIIDQINNYDNSPLCEEIQSLKLTIEFIGQYVLITEQYKTGENIVFLQSTVTIKKETFMSHELHNMLIQNIL